MAIDLVCKMIIDEKTAKWKSEYQEIQTTFVPQVASKLLTPTRTSFSNNTPIKANSKSIHSTSTFLYLGWP